jgi:hypothetical protein
MLTLPFKDRAPCSLTTLLLFLGTAINAVLDASLRSLCDLVISLPLETELVTCAAQFVIALAGSRNAARLSFVVASEHVGRLAVYATSLSATAAAAQQGVCRLNGAGLAAVVEALGQLFVRSKHEDYFAKVSVLTTNVTVTAPHHNHCCLLICLSCARQFTLCWTASWRCSTATCFSAYSAPYPVLRGNNQEHTKLTNNSHLGIKSHDAAAAGVPLGRTAYCTSYSTPAGLPCAPASACTSTPMTSSSSTCSCCSTSRSTRSADCRPPRAWRCTKQPTRC